VLDGEDKRHTAGRNKRHGRHDHSAHRCGSHDVGPSAGTLARQHYTAFSSEMDTGETPKMASELPMRETDPLAGVFA
jgi:hypothetical protein